MAPRRYSSPVREAQSEQTRERLLVSTDALLRDGGLDALTLPRLAQHAEVSVPTVYRHFATMDDLLRAFLAWIRPRLGHTADRLLATTPDEVHRLPIENFGRFEEHAAVLHPLMESRAWNRIRVGSMNDRAARGAAAMRPVAPAWSDRDLEGAAGAIYALASPQTWRWLRETWGVDADTAMHAAAWGMRVMTAALAEHPGLTEKKRAKPAATTRRRKP